MTIAVAVDAARDEVSEPAVWTCEPIFVVGAPGSGSAAVHEAIATHRSLWGGETSEFMAPLLATLPSVYEGGTERGRLDWLVEQRVPYEEFALRLGTGIDRMFSEWSAGQRWVDHSPVYARFLEPLSLLFPTASIVFVNRDGRQVAAAMERDVPGLSHESSCRIWQRYADAWRRAGSSGLRLLEVRHDRMSADPDAELRRIFDFLGEPHEEQAVAVLREALDAEAAVTWSHWDGGARRVFVEEAGVGLRALGFATDTSWVGRLD